MSGEAKIIKHKPATGNEIREILGQVDLDKS